MIFTIIICKIILFFGNLVGRGSNLPGHIALKLNKNILAKFKLPENIVAVTGSSGKGTTSTMIASVLRSQGKKVVHNHRGGNLKPGIVTMLIEASTLTGKIKADYIVYEIDERYIKQVVNYLKPQVVVITNIVRDQPPRQGHFDFVYEDIKKCLSKDIHLILNSDDPYLQKFTLETDCKATYYGINRNDYSYTKNNYENLVIQHCPICNTKLKYNYYNFEIYGDYYCPKCSFKRIEPEYAVTKVDYEKEIMIINNKYEIKILNNLLYNINNIAATVATIGYLGFDIDEFIKEINNSKYDHKLYNHYLYNGKEIFVFYNKNENSTSFNQSLNFVCRNKELKTVVIGWETISHRYKFTDVSWIYDINFESLNDANVDQLICIGDYAYDIATRLKMAGFKKNQIQVFPTLDDSLDTILNKSNGNIYAVVNPDYVLPLIHMLKGKEK